MRNAGTIIGIILVVMLLLGLLGGVSTIGGYGVPGFSNQFGVGPNALGTILSLVFWALIIGGILLLFRWISQNAGMIWFTAALCESSLALVKARYARGEISQELFEELRRDLVA